MRILLVLKRFDFGGAENHVCDLANTLSELGHDVYLVAGHGRQVSRLRSNVKFFAFRFADYLLPVNVIKLFLLSRKYHIDIIHAHQRVPILSASILRRLTGMPVVATVHGRTRFDLKSKFARKTVDRIIFVSNQVLQVSACYDKIKDKSVVIPNGVVVSTSHFIKNPHSICYVSRIDKNHSKVILLIIRNVLPSLVNEFQGITFDIIGEGKSIGKIKKEAEALNSKFDYEVCKIWGYQPDAKGIFTRSSLVLGVGRVALEALACSIPVLSVNQKRLGSIVSTSNYSEYKINNFLAIASVPPTADELLRILKDFFSNFSKWNEETRIVQGFIEAEFNLQKIAGRVVGTYNEVIETSCRNPLGDNSQVMRTEPKN